MKNHKDTKDTKGINHKGTKVTKVEEPQTLLIREKLELVVK